MKKLFVYMVLAVSIAISTADAQIKIPAASSATTITQGVGIHDVTLSYQRPNINGRVVFGELVPFGQVWRTGANNIPVLTFKEEVSVEGHAVPAGTYGVLTIPEQNKWTVILTKNAQQWGAYEYKQEEDFLRFDVVPTTLSEKVESFTMSFDNVTAKSTQISLAWENTKVAFGITVDQSKEILASIEEAMKGDKKPYFQAAQYYYFNDLDIQQAIEWATLAEQENDDAPWIKYWRARMHLKAGDKKGAIEAAQRGVAVATRDSNPEYIKLNNQVLEEAKK